MDALTGPNDYDIASRLAQKTCAEFFAGIGLMRIGLEKQGWPVIFANDIDEEKFRNVSCEFRLCRRALCLQETSTKLATSQVPSATLATASISRRNGLSLAGAR